MNAEYARMQRRHLSARGKSPVQICTAIARELTGIIWAIGQQAEIGGA